MTKWQAILHQLDSLSRTRALSEQESIYLEKAIEMTNPSRPWTDHDDGVLLDMLADDTSMAVIAEKLGRTKNAVSGRIARIRGKIGWQAA